MIKNQLNKIAIVNDPFNYLFDKLSIGSILFVDNYFAGLSTYQHYGVYIGNGNVIHFAPAEGKEISIENGIIHETTLEKFLNGRALQTDTNIEKKFPEDEIVMRARSRINEKGYDLLLNNCEHFARWCVTGESISYQVINSPQKIENTILTIKENYNMITKFFELFN
jgi:HRAS-like suppressor 3